MLRGEPRLLLADEVGLGKTVQASLILAELRAREVGARCLVLAPAGLCGQWVGELGNRFGLEALHVDAPALRRLACLCPPDVTPWEHVPLAVASFDFVKQLEVLSAMATLRWDALVVDEAHMAALAPDRARAIGLLAARARRIILLTATPHAADTEGFRALCNVARLPGDPPIVLFRRTRAALGMPRTRRVSILRVRLTAEERRMHGALRRYVAAVWRNSPETQPPAPGRGPTPAARLAMIVLAKRGASGPSALAASLARRLRSLSSEPAPGAWQLLLPLEADEDRDPSDEEPDSVLTAPGLHDREIERRQVSNLLDLARAACRAESKLRVLERLLRRTREPAIVFTEYRDTLTHLADGLRPTTTVALLHGGLDQTARREAVAAFTSGRARVLVATDAAAHGLNLQARCRIVVDMELPWTPARLEQRIGRVDRIGQKRLVHAMHLVAEGTAEEQVLARLVRRIDRERAALGSADNPLGAAAELDIARIVFAGRPEQRRLLLEWGTGPQLEETRSANGARREARDALPPAAADSECRSLSLGLLAADERTRLEHERRLAASRFRQPKTGHRQNGGLEVPGLDATPADDLGTPPGPCWTVLRRRRGMAMLAPGLACVFVVRIADDRGSLVENALVALHVDLERRFLGREALARFLPRLLDACRPALQAEASRLGAERLETLNRFAASRVASLAAREDAGARAAAAAPACQPGLFDRRALKAAEAGRQRRAREAAEAAARLASLSGSARLRLSGDPELVLVLGIAQ
jgi:superfamily II DNA or RNA helicase